MKEDRLLWLCERIYSTFGKPAPKQNSPQFQVLKDNLADLPDECLKYIARKVTDLDDMPKNLTKFCMACWMEWLADNGNAYYESCPTCSGNGGWTYFKQIEGKDGMEWHEFFSPCPTCTSIPQRLREKIRPLCRLPWDLEKQGCLVVPNNYKGGVLQFMSDTGIGQYVPPLEENAYAKKIQNLKFRLAARMTA